MMEQEHDYAGACLAVIRELTEDFRVPEGACNTYRVMLDTNGRNWAFALDMPERWSGENSLRMGSDYQLGTFFGPPRSRRMEYTVTSYVDYRAREPLTSSEIEVFRRLPDDSSPRARALAQSWLVDAPNDATIIARAMDYLRSQPYFYTLTPPALGSQPVDEFLFETREGFCEHDASATTVLMRAAGLPARVVMGYQGGELNGFGGYYIVRQSHAHSWVEVLTADGWRTYDPTSSREDNRAEAGVWQSIKHFFDFIEFKYANSVIAYDNDHRDNLIANGDMETGTLSSWTSSGPDTATTSTSIKIEGAIQVRY